MEPITVALPRIPLWAALPLENVEYRGSDATNTEILAILPRNLPVRGHLGACWANLVDARLLASQVQGPTGAGERVVDG